MSRMSFLILAFVTLLFSGACGGDSSTNNGIGDTAEPPNATEFFEPVPNQATIETHVGALLEEFGPLVTEATQAAARDYAAQYNPAALNDPFDNVDAYLAVGEMAFLMGSSSGATWAFLNAVELDPDNVYALSQLGFALTYEGRFDDARPFLLYANSLDEELHTVLVNLANNYNALNEVERCVFFLERAVILQPDNGEIRHKLAKCYFRAGYDQAGYDALEVAESLAPYSGVDIGETSSDPPESIADEGDGTITLPTGDEPDAGKLIEAVGECQMSYLTDYGERVSRYSGFGGEFDQAESTLDEAVVTNGYNSQQCQIKCGQDFPPGGEQDSCIANCLAAECALDSAAYGNFRGNILSARTNWSSAHGAVVSGFAGCAWPAYFRLRSRVPKFEADTANGMIWSQLEAAHETALVTWEDVDDRIELWLLDVAAICDYANQAIADVDWDVAKYHDPFKDMDVKICSPLLDTFCLHMTNTNVTVTTPVSLGSPANLEFTLDAKTGKFNASMTVPLVSKSVGEGAVEGGANLKLDMEKGIGVQGEAKIGGPLEKTWSTERFLFSE